MLCQLMIFCCLFVLNLHNNLLYVSSYSFLMIKRSHIPLCKNKVLPNKSNKSETLLTEQTHPNSVVDLIFSYSTR